MKKLKSLWLVSIMLLLVSYSMPAGSDGSSKAGTTSKGEVVTLNKIKFLREVFNYKKSTTKWIYGGDRPCVIDFHADWYGPRKRVTPILRDLAILYKNGIVVYKVSVDKKKELTAALGVQSIPTFLFIPKEGQPQISIGAPPRERFVRQIDAFLLKKKRRDLVNHHL